MSLGHVLVHRDVARALRAPHMAGNTCVIVEDLHCPAGEPHVDLTTDQAVRYRVEGLIDLDVIIGMNLRGFPLGDCQDFCVRPVIRHAFTKRSLNMTANWVFASDHSRGGRFHSAAAWFKTRYSSLVAASSDGKCPLVRTARRSFEFKASMALVV